MKRNPKNVEDSDQAHTAESTEGSPTRDFAGDTEPTMNDDAAVDAQAEPDVDPMTRLAAERDQLERQLQRTLADLQNFRKRRVQEMADARRASTEAIVGEMLPVLDNFHLALDYESPADGGATSSMREGLIMVRSLLESVFERHGVTEIPAAGERFDPAVHEAVGIDPDPDAAAGVITRVMQRGYTIDDRVLRPTRVMVGGAPQANDDERET